MTFCNTDPRTPEAIRAQLNQIEDAFRSYATTDENPCGGCAYYEEGDALPFRVHFADGAADEQFATVAEAIEAASDYADEMDDEA